MSELNMPDTWAETKLNDICSLITDGTHQTPTYADEGVIFLSSKNVTSGRIDWERIKYIPESLHLELSRRLKPQLNDILLAKNGTTGVGAIVDRDEVFDIYVSLALLRLIDNVSPRFILTFINSPIAKEQFNRRLKGVGVQNLHLREIREVRLGLPPYGEQERIVNYVETLFEKIDVTEQSLTKVETLLEKYRESLLAKAFRGELIPQNESDEPASVLLEKIRAEREKSAPAKKKEMQAFAPITDDEKPFDIPESWEWVRLGEYIKVKGGKRVPKGESLIDTKTDYPYIRVADMKKMTVSLEKLKYLSKEVYDTIKNYTISKDDLYITVAGTIGRIGYVPAELDNANLTENADKLTSFDDVFHKDFLMYMLLSRFVQEQIRDKTKQVAQPKLSVENINQLILVVPPLHEQKNILRQVVESLCSIKKIKKQNKVKLDFINLMRESVLEKAFEGRLVEQIESEGTGQELLEKILKAKAEEAPKKKVAKKKVTKKTVKKKTTKKK